MKQTLFVGLTLASALLFSCKDSTTTSSTDTVQRNRQHAEAIYAAFSANEPNRLDSFIAADVVDHGMGDGHEIKGIDSLKAMITDWHKHVSNLKMEIKQHASNGEYDFAWVRMTGTTIDPYMGMPANTAFDQTSVDVVRVDKDGKVLEHWGYVDPKDMMEMMAHPGELDHSKMSMPKNDTMPKVEKMKSDTGRM